MEVEGNTQRCIRIGQMSDLHLGYRQYGKFERAMDFFKYAKTAAELLISNKPDIVLIPGDVYHRVRPYPIDQLHAIQVFNLFREAGIPVCVIRGNHDANYAWSQRHRGDVLNVLQDLGFVLYLDDRIEKIKLSSGECIHVWGLGYHGTEISLKLEKLVRENETLINDKDSPNVLLLHDYLSNMLSSSRLNEHIAKKYGFDYIAVGHSHNWWENKTQTICCTGSTEHVRSDEWFEPNRSVAITTLSKEKRGWNPSIERLTYKVRLKKNIRLELGSTTVENAIKSIKNALHKADEKDAIIKVYVNGTLSDTQQSIDVRSALQIAKESLHVMIIPEINYSDISISDDVPLQDLMKQVFVESLGVSKRKSTSWISLAEDMKQILAGSLDSEGEAAALDLLYNFVSSSSSKSKIRRSD